MRRLYYPIPTGVETQHGDDALPFVRGWPMPGTTYDPSAPGTTFNTWTANAGGRSYSSPFTMSVDFDFTHLANGAKGLQQLWVPPAGKSFLILSWAMVIAAITHYSAGAPANNVTIGIATATNAVAMGYALLQKTIPNTDAGWKVSGSDEMWVPNAPGVSGFVVGAGDNNGSDTLGIDVVNGAFYRGRPSMFNMPFVAGGITYDRFAVFAQNTQPGTPLARYVGTVFCTAMLIG